MSVQDSLDVLLVPHGYFDTATLESVARAFRELRLRALLSDPASFSSSYASESQRPPSFWMERLQNPQARTFALAHKVTEADAPKSEFRLCKPWLGMLVLLGPNIANPATYNDQLTWKTLMTENSHHRDKLESEMATTEISPAKSVLIYHIVAVYVAPEARAQGSGKKLMEAALAMIERDSKEKRIGKASCTVGVADEILAARKTYEAMQFVPVAKDRFISDDGRKFDETVMRRNFDFALE